MKDRLVDTIRAELEAAGYTVSGAKRKRMPGGTLKQSAQITLYRDRRGAIYCFRNDLYVDTLAKCAEVCAKHGLVQPVDNTGAWHPRPPSAPESQP